MLVPNGTCPRRNCCHFAEVFAQNLGVGPLPHWVLNLAAAGATLTDVVAGAGSEVPGCAELVVSAFRRSLGCSGCFGSYSAFTMKTTSKGVVGTDVIFEASIGHG